MTDIKGSTTGDSVRRISGALLRADRNAKRLVAMVADIVSCAIAVAVSFSLRLGYWQYFSDPMAIMLIVETALFLPIFVFGRVYDSIFRFHGDYGLRQLVISFLWLSIPTVAIFGFFSIPGVPRTASVIFLLIFFGLVAMSRLLARMILLDMFGNNTELRKVMIYGAGSAGRQLAQSLTHEGGYRLVGYIDDDPQVVGRRLEGARIYSSGRLAEVIVANEAEIVFLAVPSLSREARTQLVRNLQAADVHVLTLPALSEIVDGNVSISDLREIDVTELLSREPVTPDPSLMNRNIEGKIVLVTGAGGSIGSELARQIVLRRPERLVLVEMTEAALYAIDMETRAIAAEHGVEIDIVPELASIEKPHSAKRIFARYSPHTVYHAAAYKHVPLVEANVVSGVSNNIRGTQHCAQAACETGIERFILISTDKAVRPTNVMGASKRVCEMVLQALAAEPACKTVFSMVRFGNVLDSSGSVVPRFKQQIAVGGPVSITHPDITRYFMTIPEAAELVIQAGAMAEGGEVYLLDMGDPVKIIDLAHTMIRLSGRTVRDEHNPDGDIAIVETGLRPGEKLFEELLIDAEAQPTEHSRIFKATEAMIGWSTLEAVLRRLEDAARDGDSLAIRTMLHELVPGFHRPQAGAGE